MWRTYVSFDGNSLAIQPLNRFRAQTPDLSS